LAQLFVPAFEAVFQRWILNRVLLSRLQLEVLLHGVRAVKLKEISLHPLHELTHVDCSHSLFLFFLGESVVLNGHQYNFSSTSKAAHIRPKPTKTDLPLKMSYAK
jgi:hypothetical protein